MKDENGTMKRLTTIIAFATGAVLVTVFLLSQIFAAQTCADRANQRLDGLEPRLNRIEMMLDKILVEVKK